MRSHSTSLSEADQSEADQSEAAATSRYMAYARPASSFEASIDPALQIDSPSCVAVISRRGEQNQLMLVVHEATKRHKARQK
jgi:hypothetical protein